MGDVIDRDSVLRKLYRFRDRCEQKRKENYRVGQIDGINYAMETIQAADPLEVVTVVRCRDCLHASERDKSLVYCGIHNKHRDPEDFCNFGEQA